MAWRYMVVRMVWRVGQPSRRASGRVSCGGRQQLIGGRAWFHDAGLQGVGPRRERRRCTASCGRVRHQSALDHCDIAGGEGDGDVDLGEAEEAPVGPHDAGRRGPGPASAPAAKVCPGARRSGDLGRQHPHQQARGPGRRTRRPCRGWLVSHSRSRPFDQNLPEATVSQRLGPHGPVDLVRAPGSDLGHPLPCEAVLPVPEVEGRRRRRCAGSVGMVLSR